ncbi:MAG: Cys-tRNA(Pro)/Cys-tRNA(Cys) deacylase [Ignavibacteriales bacterium]
MSKTNAVRILESKGIHYTLHEYEVDESDLSGGTVARKIGAESDEVFKTLVTIGDKTGVTVFVIPVTAELNLKKAAAVSGNKKIEMAKLKDVFDLTGYIRGGCSPVGMKKHYPVYLDELSGLFDFIYISAGVRGTQMRLKPDDLISVTDAITADLL